MTPEEKAKLERTLALAEENNQLLRGIRRSNRISAAMRILYWVVIIAVSYGAFYLIQPYLSFMTGLIGGMSGIGRGLDVSAVSEVLNQLQTP